MKAKTVKQVPVSERALVQRINRVLAKEGEKLIKARGRDISSCGQYYTILFSFNAVGRKDVGIEELGRDLGALRPWEMLADE